jgi:hypothetical protein
LLQHAGLANVLLAPTLEGFRSSMTEWRVQLQSQQDAASVSMLKKVCFASRGLWCRPDLLALTLSHVCVAHHDIAQVDRICRSFAQRD